MSNGWSNNPVSRKSGEDSGVPAQAERAFERFDARGAFALARKRYIEGVATSDEITSHGQCRDPMGWEFQLPFPFCSIRTGIAS